MKAKISKTFGYTWSSNFNRQINRQEFKL